jgi:hypothetical protein
VKNKLLIVKIPVPRDDRLMIHKDLRASGRRFDMGRGQLCSPSER